MNMINTTEVLSTYRQRSRGRGDGFLYGKNRVGGSCRVADGWIREMPSRFQKNRAKALNTLTPPKRTRTTTRALLYPIFDSFQ